MLCFVFQISAAHNTDAAMRKETTFVERTISFHSCFMKDYAGDKSKFRHGELTKWKTDQCGRFDILPTEVSSYDTEFQLAFQIGKLWEQLCRIFEMHKKGILKGMKAPVASNSARQAGAQFMKRMALKATQFKAFNEKISVNVKESILSSVILLHKTLPEMAALFVLHKGLAQTEVIFAWLAGCDGDWDKCLAKFSPQFTSEKVLTRFVTVVGAITAKNTNLALASREGAELHAPVSLKNWVSQANVAHGSRVLTDDSQSKSWEKLSIVEKLALRTTLQTFNGATFGHKLADGTPLCETMRYKVLLADSCDRDWMGNAATLAKATEDLSVASDAFRDHLEHQVDLVAELLPGDLYRDALKIQVALEPPVPPPQGSRVLPADMVALQDFLEDVDLSVRKKVVNQFAGVHLHHPRGHPELTGVLLGDSSYHIIENDMLIVSIIL